MTFSSVVLNYIAITGPLSCIGRAGEALVPPLNLVGDFGICGMLLARLASFATRAGETARQALAALPE
jgi:hypothetical protein